ncbi:hypothetical protein ACIQLG_19665 [Terribacillus saccharophilus]|uniref:hypothetical protein n=1 Tax=Terribacillus saccharophilus TaxID=361277 RepID=UPI003817164B
MEANIYGDLRKPIIRRSLFPAYLLMMLLPHILLYSLMTNYSDIKPLLAVLLLYTTLMIGMFLFYFRAPIYTLYHLVFLICFQSLLVGVGMNFTADPSGERVKLLMVYKEFYAIILAVLLFVAYKSKTKFFKFENLVFLLGGWMALSFLISDGNLENKFYYIRSFLIVFVAYFIGRFVYTPMKNNAHKFQKYYSLIVLIGIIASVVGFIFMSIDTHSTIWRDIFNLGHILEAKGTAYSDYPDYFTSIGPNYVPRMFSFFFDAINLAYFMLVALLASFLVKSRNMFFVRIILLAGLTMTFGKGAFAILAAVLVWYLFLGVFKINPRLFVTIFLMAIIGAFFVIESSSFRSSIGVHFEGFVIPFTNMLSAPIGNGLGAGGVYYAMANDLFAWNLTYMGAESFIGTLIYQLGIPGFLIYILFFANATKHLLRFAYRGEKIDQTYIMLSGIIFCSFIISFFQEATLGINYTGLLIVICGFAMSRVKAHTEE